MSSAICGRAQLLGGVSPLDCRACHGAVASARHTGHQVLEAELHDTERLVPADGTALPGSEDATARRRWPLEQDGALIEGVRDPLMTERVDPSDPPIRLQAHSPAWFLLDPMMSSAEEHEIGQARAACGPGPHMIHVAEPRVDAAARESTARIAKPNRNEEAGGWPIVRAPVARGRLPGNDGPGARVKCVLPQPPCLPGTEDHLVDPFGVREERLSLGQAGDLDQASQRNVWVNVGRCLLRPARTGDLDQASQLDVWVNVGRRSLHPSRTGDLDRASMGLSEGNTRRRRLRTSPVGVADRFRS